MKRLFYFIVITALFLSMAIGVNAQKPFEGQVLNISTMDGKPLTTILEVLPLFEERTGAKVIIDSAYSSDAHAKAMLSMASGSGAYDLVMWSTEFAGEIYQYLEPLTDYIAKEDDPTNFTSDFLPFIQKEMQYDDVWYALPYRVNTFALAYRTDLFKKYGVSTDINTMTDLKEACKKLILDTTGDGKTDTWAIALIGSPKAAYFFVNPFIWAYGADYFDKDWNCTINAPEFVAAIENFVSLFEYSVPGSKDFSDDEALTAMQQGKGAMCLTESPYIMKMTDPEQSTVWDKISVLPVPIEKPGYISNFSSCFGHGIAKDAKNKPLAWEFIKYLASRESIITMAEKFGNMPSRVSVFNDPLMEKAIPGFAAWSKALMSGRGLLVFPESSEILTIFGEELAQAITGTKTPKQACDDAAERAIEVMTEAGYYN